MEQRHSQNRRVKFKVPKGIQSKVNEIKSPVSFKNLTDDYVTLYWIDFQGKAVLYAELNPVNRTDEGFSLTTFVTHPWVAIYKGKYQALLNGKRYFNPPNPELWNRQINGWMNAKWNCLTKNAGNVTTMENVVNDNDVNNDISEDMENIKEDFLEVLILAPGCSSLKNLTLLRCCEIYSKTEIIQLTRLPRKLTMEMKLCRQKYFWW